MANAGSDLTQQAAHRAKQSRRRPIYYGWIIVAALAITEPISWGILFYGFGVMLTPMQQELGWSQAELTGAFSLMLLVAGLAAIPVGRWIDRHGARGLMTLGSCLATVAILAWAQVQTLFGFYVIWAAIGVICAMILYEPAFAVTTVWFNRRRSQALTVLTLGGGMASVVFVPLATWLAENYGWRTSLWMLAALLAAVTIPLHALVLRRSPAQLHLLPDGDPLPPPATPAAATAPHTPPHRAHGVQLGHALRSPAFWWIAGAFALATLSAIALAVHLLPFLTGQGYSRHFAALAAGVLGGSQIPGRLIFGPLGSRVPLRRVTALLFVLMMGGLLILLAAPAPWLILVGAALFGMGSGATSPARAALVGEFYGVAHYGAINGAMALVQTATRAGAPVAMGLIYTWTGGYTVVFWVLAACAAAAVGAVLAARPTPLAAD